VRTDVRVLDDSGNLIDSCALATIAALQHFRRPEVTICGTDVTIHSLQEREPVPLSIHHVPLCVTFGFFSDNNIVVVDPEMKEELIMDGRMTLTMNVHQELCGLQKGGGNAIAAADVVKCVKIAAVKTEALNALLQAKLEQFWDSRKRKRTVVPVGFSQVPDDSGAQGTAPLESVKSIFEGDLPAKIVSAMPAFQISPNEDFNTESDRVLKPKRGRVKLINSTSNCTIPAPVGASSANNAGAVANKSVLATCVQTEKDSSAPGKNATKKQAKPISTELLKLGNVVAEWGGDNEMIDLHLVQPQRKKSKQKDMKKTAKKQIGAVINLVDD